MITAIRKSKQLENFSDEKLAQLALRGLVIEQDGFLYPALSGGVVTAKAFTNAAKHLSNGDVDWDDNATTTIRTMLTTVTYTPDQDAHEFKSSVTNEVSGTGYTARGAAITARAISVDTASNETRLTGNNVSWTTASFTARYAIVYKDTGTDSTSILLGYVDFGADQTVSAGTFSITWDSTGVLKFTAS